MTTPAYADGFRSLETETRLDALETEGEIPSWLSGRLLRTGPAKFEVESQSYNHWFDGLAMLHGFRVDDGEVSYANRFLRSNAFEQAREKGEISVAEFATDPCRSIFGRVMSVFDEENSNNANVNVARLGERFVAMTETPMPVEFDPETLETVGPIDSPSTVKADVTTAHPHFDTATGRSLNCMLKYGRTSRHRVVATDPDTLERQVIGEVETDEPAYVHSFGMTENYIVLVAFPYVVNPLDLLARSKPFIENFEWKPQLGTRFWVIRKSDGELVEERRAEARFAFHHVNAFEAEDDIVVDIATYPDASIIDDLFLDHLRAGEDVDVAGRLERFHLPQGTSEVEIERLSETGIELPRIHYDRFNASEYGVVWGVGVRNPGNFVDRIVRIDVPDGDSQEWYTEGCFPGEPVFVPRPDSGGEDDGILLSIVLDSDAERSFLLLLDARDLSEIGRAHVPHHIPFQFHGNFYSN